jgi:signal transduction histidine kinase
MSILDNKPIKLKLMLLFTATATSALLLACTAFWVYEAFAYIGTLKQESATIAQMLADSSAAAITFNDPSAAKETLSWLRADPRVEKACIYEKDGTVLASFAKSAGPDGCEPTSGISSFRLTAKHLFIHYPVLLHKENVGELSIRISLSEMYLRLARFGGIGLVVLLLASLLAVMLSLRWQHLISDPIIHLTRVAEEVSSNADYSIRAATTSDDEMGVLIGQFNAMMEQINRRDLALQEAQDKLEIRVKVRTQDLQDEIAERMLIESDLLNAKASAEASNHAKSAFLANMSHELRTPLNAIIGYSEMLEEDAEAASDHEAVSDLKRIQSAGRHLLSLVSDILDLSKIEAGKIEIHLETVDIRSIIDSVTQTMQPLARKGNNRFSVETVEWNGTILVDPTKFYQALLNLLSNACKFTENGRITLTVESTHNEKGEWICWHVSDTGIGISEVEMQKLFQPFSQVDSSATRKHGGTGLGLVISQRLCRLMGGVITVQSVPGCGTTFTIHMPALTASIRANEWIAPKPAYSVGALEASGVDL